MKGTLSVVNFPAPNMLLILANGSRCLPFSATPDLFLPLFSEGLLLFLDFFLDGLLLLCFQSCESLLQFGGVAGHGSEVRCLLGQTCVLFLEASVFGL